MKILHISDIHYRASTENDALLKQASGKFEQLHPDYILITGDLTRDGRDEQLAFVRHFIDELSFCHTLTIPGNRDAARTAVASADDYKNLGYYLLTHPDPLTLLDELDGQKAADNRIKSPEKFFTHFENAEFFYRDTQIAAAGLHSTPEITSQQMELAARHYLNGQAGELRIFCAHHSFLPVPTKKLRPGDIVPRAADILQTLIELNVDLLCCGHIHRSHVWDLSDGGHRLLCCNAGSLLDISGKKDNGYLEIDIEHNLQITKRSLFTTQSEVLYYRPHFGDIVEKRRQAADAPGKIMPASQSRTESAESMESERPKTKRGRSRK